MKRFALVAAAFLSGCGGHRTDDSTRSKARRDVPSSVVIGGEASRRMSTAFSSSRWALLSVPATASFPVMAFTRDGWLVVPSPISGYALVRATLHCERSGVDLGEAMVAGSDAEVPVPAPAARVRLLTREVASAACGAPPSVQGSPRDAVRAARAAFLEQRSAGRPLPRSGRAGPP